MEKEIIYAIAAAFSIVLGFIIRRLSDIIEILREINDKLNQKQ